MAKLAQHKFEKEKLITIFDEIIGHTLGEIDVNNVFDKTLTNPKITGIAGDVIEQSVLGYPADNKQEADLLVDGIATELKTTGLKHTRNKKHTFEAKEPMSVTAVSPNKIILESFYNSTLWHKLENMLLVYYLYDSDHTVPASEYAKFPIQGYQFHKFSDEDISILKNDWHIVRDFIEDVQKNNKNINTEYPKISKLREQMLYLDTAPKYPNPPRFRLKRHVVNTIAQEHLGKDFQLLKAGNTFSSYKELDTILNAFTKKHKGKSIKQLASELDLDIKKNKDGKVSKSIAEKILTSVFGVKSEKLRNIDTFSKIGTIPKTLTITKTGGRTEDTKFDTIDFSEWLNENISFEKSTLYDFFANQTLLFSIFQEAYNGSPLEENIFLGFKRINFDDDFIEKNVKPVWDNVRDLVWNKQFKVSPVYNKKTGDVIINKSGVIKEKTNFPKSKDYIVFLKGTGSDATVKPLNLNGYQIYPQQFWIKGSFLVDALDKIDFI